MNVSLQEIARKVGAELAGDGGVQLDGIASLQSADERKLVFAENEKAWAAAAASRAGAVIAGEFARGARSGKPVLVSAQPRLAFARAAQMFAAPRPPAGVDPTAVVDPTAALGTGVGVGARAVIGPGARLGEGTRIAAGCVIAAGVEIGRQCELYPNVTVYGGTRLGDRVIVHAGAVLGSDGFGYVRDSVSGRYEKSPQIGRLEIGDDVEIGANATVDRGALDATRIGRGTKIDNLVHVGHNAEIGEDVVIAAQTGVSGSTVVERDVVIGGQVGLADHVVIEEGAILGAQCGVPSKKIIRGKGVVFWGTPARPIQEYLRHLAALARLARK